VARVSTREPGVHRPGGVLEEPLLHRLVLLAALLFATPALAGQPYTPLKVADGKTVTPPAELIADAKALYANLTSGNGDGIAEGFADKVTTLDGSIELEIPRNTDVVGPFKTIEEMLEALGYSTGGILPGQEDGTIVAKTAINAERQYVVDALTDGVWGSDPLVKGGICTYAYRSYDTKALKRLAAKMDVQSSSFFFVDAPLELRAAPDAGAAVVATLQPGLLYALDYDTDAPGRWLAVHLPEGGVAFANTDTAVFDKPYVAGVCFGERKDGKWVIIAQASTSL
jgi:hypothetical protein